MLWSPRVRIANAQGYKAGIKILAKKQQKVFGITQTAQNPALESEAGVRPREDGRIEVPTAAGIFLFDEFRLDRGDGGLFRRDERGEFVRVSIGARALDVLEVLIERAGALVSKDAIMAAVWPHMAVENANLTIQISALRRVLDQGRPEGSCIRTVAAQGYRFVAPVIRVEDAEDSRVGGAARVPRMSIVVLPFANLSSDPEQEYFADGITDDLTTDLSRISGSFVIARNTAFHYKARAVDVKRLGRELGVRYALEGSVRRAGDWVRVNIQLTDAESGRHLWADRFDTHRANLAESQNEIVGRLARTLNLKLVEAAGGCIEQERVSDPEAHDLVMRGWALYYRPYSRANQQEALQTFERALAVDPQSVDARIGLATVLVSRISHDWSCSPAQDSARAEALVLEAIERDTNSSAAHYAMAGVRRVQSRLTDSRIENEAAIALDPNHARAIFQLGQTLMYLGQPQAAIPYVEKALRLSPHDSNIAAFFGVLGRCRLYLGQDEAIDLLRRALAANPRLYYYHLTLAGALALKGYLDEAKAGVAEAIRLNPAVNSLAAWRQHRIWETNPAHWAFAENTLSVGWRRAGLPEE
jgi:TolB-like protein/Tfp pilus assembly protein PilF